MTSTPSSLNSKPKKAELGMKAKAELKHKLVAIKQNIKKL
jgi:hypothetical protein